LFVQDVLDVRLDEGEGLLHFPCPEGWIEGLAAFAGSLDWVTAAQNVADGVRGDLQFPPLEVKGQPLPAVVCSLASLPTPLLYVRGGLARGVVGPAGIVLKPFLSLCLEAAHPLAYHRSAELTTKPGERCAIGGRSR